MPLQTLSGAIFGQRPIGQATGTVDITLPQVPLKSAPIVEAHSRNLEVRLYDSGTGLRKRLASYQVGAGTHWTVEPNGGFSDFALDLFFSPGVDLPGIEDDDCVEIWNFGVRQFRGYASDIEWSEDEPGKLTVGGYGRLLDLLRMLMPGAYQFPQQVDVSQMFALMAADIQTRYPDIVVSVDAIGVLTQTIDARTKTAKAALDSVYDICAGVAVWGFDVDPDSNADRLYLSAIGTS